MNLCKTAVQDNNILIQIAEPGLVYLGRFNITATSDALCGPLVENFQFKMLQMNANVRGKMQQQKIGCDTVCETGSELLFVYHGADVYWVQLRREGGILACRLLQIVPTCHSCVKFLEQQSGCAENAKRIVTSFQDLGGSTGWKVKGCQVAQMGRIMLFFSSKIKQNVGGAFFGFLDLDTQNDSVRFSVQLLNFSLCFAPIHGAAKHAWKPTLFQKNRWDGKRKGAMVLPTSDRMAYILEKQSTVFP